MSKLKLLLCLSIAVIITGCAHPIQISPDLSSLRSSNSKASKANAGYFISTADLSKQVTTPGGGGDDVSYFPYKDTELAIKTILQQKFKKVYSLKSATTDPLIKQKNIKFIFSPKIKTNSSSSSFLTWPPTDFSIELTCIAYSANGKNIWKKTVTGKGHAEFSEFKNEFALSAKRATNQAFKLMRDEILSAKILK